MPRVRFTLPEVKEYPDTRPSSCPYCSGVIFHRHGVVQKAIRALYVKRVRALRYRCVECGRTFRHYPEGVDGHVQSKRLRALAALSWALGLSHRSVSDLLSSLGCGLSRMSSWRDVQEAGTKAVGGWLGRMRGRVSVLGADETVVKVRGKRVVVGFATDAVSGGLLGIDILADRDSEGFVRWLSGYVGRLGVRALVSDDLSTYKPVAERLGVEHQVCLAHVRKNVSVRLDEIEGWEEYKGRIWELLNELDERGGLRLLDMERRVRGEPKLRRLVVDLCNKWRSLLCHRRYRSVPSTNNCTERVIGRSKIRYKTVRGYKSMDGMMNGLGLTQWVWRGEDGLDLSELVAA